MSGEPDVIIRVSVHHEVDLVQFKGTVFRRIERNTMVKSEGDISPRKEVDEIVKVFQ